MNLAERLYHGAVATGGETLDRNVGEPITSGYAVGGRAIGLVIPGTVSPVETISMVDEWLSTIETGAVGSWLNENTFYFDAVDIIPTFREAKGKAFDRGELAIYSLHEKKEIRLY